jgi:DNA-binding transcriptional ArsR family regulator
MTRSDLNLNGPRPTHGRIGRSEGWKSPILGEDFMKKRKLEENVPRWRERLIIAELAARFQRMLNRAYFPTKGAGQSAELSSVNRAVWIGHLAGQAMTLRELAMFTELSRATVQRKLDQLMKLGYVHKRGTRYWIADPLLRTPRMDLDKTIAMLRRALAAIDREQGPFPSKAG